MAKRSLPIRSDSGNEDLRLGVHEALLAQLLAQVARDSGVEALSTIFIGAQQHMINLRVVRGESPVNNPAIKEIERHFNRVGALMHAVLVKYSKDRRSFLMLGQ
jgi:hypothetical protein